MRSSSGSNNNNRSSILALFLDAPTTDAPLTLPSVRPATRPGHLALVLDARASCLPSPRKQRRDAVKRASARWRHDRARGWPSATTAAQTLSPAGAAGLMAPAAASSFVAGLVDGLPHGVVVRGDHGEARTSPRAARYGATALCVRKSIKLWGGCIIRCSKWAFLAPIWNKDRIFSPTSDQYFLFVSFSRTAYAKCAVREIGANANNKK